jgi:Gluconate 2-dehydrogenase subunit 3
MTPTHDEQSLIDRREAIRRVSLLLGGAALVGCDALLAQPRARNAPADATTRFTPDDVTLLDAIADTILPETKTPGAKAAQVGAFMALMVADAYGPKDQQIFREGMQQLSEASFMTIAPAQRLALLEQLDREQKAYQDAKAGDAPNHFFRMMKELALVGYFTSEIGMTRAQRYLETPGRFDSCAPYAAGEVSWAPHA